MQELIETPALARPRPDLDSRLFVRLGFTLNTCTRIACRGGCRTSRGNASSVSEEWCSGGLG